MKPLRTSIYVIFPVIANKINMKKKNCSYTDVMAKQIKQKKHGKYTTSCLDYTSLLSTHSNRGSSILIQDSNAAKPKTMKNNFIALMGYIGME